MIEEKIEKFLKIYWKLISIAPCFNEGFKTYNIGRNIKNSKKSAAYKLYVRIFRPVLIALQAMMLFVYAWDLLFFPLKQLTFALAIIHMFSTSFVILNNVFVSPLMEYDNLTRKAMLLDQNLSSK